MTEHERSPELDKVRRLLFPKLPPEEGWKQMDAALEGASDPEKRAAIDQIADEEDLDEALRRELRKLLEPPLE
jgi:hypothetical protein